MVNADNFDTLTQDEVDEVLASGSLTGLESMEAGHMDAEIQ